VLCGIRAAGTSVVSAPPSGEYALHGLTADTYVVTPSSPEAVFYHVQTSTNCADLAPYSTKAAQPSGLFEFNDTNTAPISPRMFRVMRP